MAMSSEARNVSILAAAQALYGTSLTILLTLNGLVGLHLAPDAALATLPSTAMVIGTAVSTVPASLLMQRFGRRAGFMGGALTALVGAVLACVAIRNADFLLFVLSGAAFGVYNATAQYYRFAAADAASPAFRPRAIGYVIAGGIVAAFLGPTLVMSTRDLLLPVEFLGAYMAVTAIVLVNIAVTSQVNIPPLPVDPTARAARPLRDIVRQPAFGVAVFAAAVAQGTMTLVMTATPIAMIGCAHSIDSAAFVIQWHVLAMYVPALITGNLIARIGPLPVIGAGLALLTACSFVALSGIDLASFWFALVFVGLGWSLTYVGATTLLAEAYAPAERGKAQGFNDLIVFAVVAAASFASGQVLAHAGWKAVNWLPLPVILLNVALIVRLGWMRRQESLGRA